MRRFVALLIGIMTISLLSACGSNPAETQYRQHPRDFMRQVVQCESNYAAIGQTPECRNALQLNARLFGSD